MPTPNAKGAAKGKEPDKGKGKDDAASKKAMGEMGKDVHGLEKQVAKIVKLQEQAAKSPDEKLIKQLSDEIQSLSKMLGGLEKSSKEMVGNMR